MIDITAAMTDKERGNIAFINDVCAAVDGFFALDFALAERIAIVTACGPLWYSETFEGRDTTRIASGEIALLEQIRGLEITMRPKAIRLLKFSIFYDNDRWPESRRIAERLGINYTGEGSGSFREWVDRNS